MQSYIDKFKTYMEFERGFTKETIVKYSGNLVIMFKKMKIYDVSQVKKDIINNRLLDEFWRDFQSGSPISDSTRVNYLASLKNFIHFLKKIDAIQDDFSGEIELPKRRLLFLEGLSKKEQKTLREYVATHLRTEKERRDAALIMFIWGTAVRVSEAISLNCHPESYIYWHDERIRSGDFYLDDGKMYVHIMGKGKRDRVIRVSSDALKYLNTYLSDRKLKNKILFHNVKNSRSSTLRLTRNAVGVIIDEVFKKCEIKKTKGLRTHVLRHTAINTWIEEGYPDLQIITMTGHSAPSGLLPYHLRDKRQTDVFGESTLSTGNITDSKIKVMEKIMGIRHAGEK